MNQRKPTDVLRLVGDFWGEFLRLLLSWFANSIWPCESAQHFECILWTSYVGISYKVGLSKKLSRYGRNTSPNTPPRPSEISEKNGFTYVLTFFSLISKGLGGVCVFTNKGAPCAISCQKFLHKSFTVLCTTLRGRWLLALQRRKHKVRFTIDGTHWPNST